MELVTLFVALRSRCILRLASTLQLSEQYLTSILRSRERYRRLKAGENLSPPFERICEQCGKTFMSGIPNAKFCHPNCRAKFYCRQAAESRRPRKCSTLAVSCSKLPNADSPSAMDCRSAACSCSYPGQSRTHPTPMSAPHINSQGKEGRLFAAITTSPQKLCILRGIAMQAWVRFLCSNLLLFMFKKVRPS